MALIADSADHLATGIGSARPFSPGSASVLNIQSERGLPIAKR